MSDSLLKDSYEKILLFFSFFYFLFTEVWIRKCFTWYMIIIGKITKTKVKKTTHNSQNMEVGLTVSWKQFILFYFIIGISVNLLTCTINDMYKFQGDHGQNVLNRLWLIMKSDWSKNGPRLSFINNQQQSFIINIHLHSAKFIIVH